MYMVGDPGWRCGPVPLSSWGPSHPPHSTSPLVLFLLGVGLAIPTSVSAHLHFCKLGLGEGVYLHFFFSNESTKYNFKSNIWGY